MPCPSAKTTRWATPCTSRCLELVDFKRSPLIVNEHYISTMTKAIEQVNHTVLLYLFSRWFEVGSALEQSSRRRNPPIFVRTRMGALERYKYYGINICWNLAG